MILEIDYTAQFKPKTKIQVEKYSFQKDYLILTLQPEKPEQCDLDKNLHVSHIKGCDRFNARKSMHMKFTSMFLLMRAGHSKPTKTETEQD